jgi:hypothetical protein
MIVRLKSEVRRLKPDVSWTALAERSGDSALLLHEKRRRTPLTATVQSMCDVRPLPYPLPQERENHSLALKNSCDWICRAAIRKERNVRLLFPRPGGAGQGEGERSH